MMFTQPRGRRPAVAAVLVLAALLAVGAPEAAVAQSRSETLQALGVSQREARDVRWGAANRAGDVLTLTDVRIGAQRWRSVAVTFAPGGTQVASVRLEGLGSPAGGVSVGSVDIFAPEGAALRGVLHLLADAAPSPKARGDAPIGAVARAVATDLGFKDADGTAAASALEVRGYRQTAQGVSIDAIALSNLDWNAVNGDRVTARSFRVERPSPELAALIAATPARAAAPGADLVGLGFADLVFEGVDARIAATSGPQPPPGGQAPGPLPVGVDLGPTRLTVDRFRIGGLSAARVEAVEIDGMALRIDDRAGKPFLSADVDGLALANVDLAYWRAYAGALGAIMAAAGPRADGAESPAVPPVPLPPGGPIDLGADRLAVRNLTVNVMGARVALAGLEYVVTRDARGAAVRLSMPPTARLDVGYMPGGGLSEVLKAGLGAIGYTSMRFTFGGEATWDPATDTSVFSDSFVAMREGFRLDYAMTLGGMSALMKAASQLGATPAPSPAQLAALSDPITLGAARLRLDDEGILARVANAVAKAGPGGGAGQTPRALRESAAQGLETSFLRSKGMETLQPVVSAFAEWLREGGQVEVTAAPATPVTGKALREAPGEALKALNLTARKR